MSISTSINQTIRAITNDEPTIADCVRLNKAAGGGLAVVSFVNGDDTLYVTGIYEDGTRWWDTVARVNVRVVRFETAEKFAAKWSALEMDLLGRELAYNQNEVNGWASVALA